MDWRDLLGDLETQMLAEERLELEAEVADRAVREAATLGIADRIRAAVGAVVRVELRGVGSVGGQLEAVGPDWLTMRETSTVAPSLVPLAAITVVRDVPAGAAPLEGVVPARYTVQMVLRRISSAGLPVVASLDDGSTRRGRLGLVGRDYVDLVDGEGGRTLIALTAVSLLRPG